MTEQEEAIWRNGFVAGVQEINATKWAVLDRLNAEIEKLNGEVARLKARLHDRKVVYETATEIMYVQKRNKRGEVFLGTREWEAVRKRVIKPDSVCVVCGSDKELHVDHIRPRKKYPELALTIENLQVLCKKCNFKKSQSDCGERDGLQEEG